MIVIEKSDGTPLITLGRMARDPVILAGFLIALKNLSEELSEISEEGVGSEPSFTFHNFGRYFVLLYSKQELLASLMIDALEIPDLHKLGNFLVFLSKTYERFIDLIWSKIPDSFRETNLIPQELLQNYERSIVSMVISPSWYDKIILSEYFLVSDTGVSALTVLYSELLRRLQSALGPKLTKLLLEKLSSKAKYGGLKIVRNGKGLKVFLYMPSDDEESMYRAIRELSRVYSLVIRKVKYIFHKNALEQLNVIESP